MVATTGDPAVPPTEPMRKCCYAVAMLAPIRPLRGRWPGFFERHADRFFWSDPRVILADEVSPSDFCLAMSAIHVGDTIKITGASRHPNADALLIEHVLLDEADIVDIGASDGSTSVDLINTLPNFKSFVIADLFFYISASVTAKNAVFFDNDGLCILVVGKRYLAWPSQSKAIQFLFRSLIRRCRSKSRQDVLLLNPAARQLLANDPRLTFKVHDIFDPWPGSPPTVIKVANLLRRLYFSDEAILRALTALINSLADGGYLLMVDNPRIAGMPPRGGLYQKKSGKFDLIADTGNIPEIDDLIRLVDV